MDVVTFDPTMLHAWLTARSVVRGLPAPVPDRGGFRVDTNSDAEIKRWVFPQLVDGLAELGQIIDTPRYLLKLCGPSEELSAILPDRWRIHPPAYFMIATRDWTDRPLPAGYTIEVDHNGAVVEVRVKSGAGDVAARGYAAHAKNVFIYDRIITAPEHRRKGLAHAVMSTLSHARRNSDAPQLLVATEDGYALYLTLGWRTLSPYSTASIATCHAQGPC